MYHGCNDGAARFISRLNAPKVFYRSHASPLRYCGGKELHDQQNGDLGRIISSMATVKFARNGKGATKQQHQRNWMQH
jgi:hypothetical protein